MGKAIGEECEIYNVNVLLPSLTLAEKIDNLMSNSITNISFIIGGSLGWSSKLSEVAKERLKLSEMTFTHQMTRVILLEQIYRSFKILRNETYHK